ncbi:hypothetical protein FA95DRAFT_1593202 [Auriscalpium vulgare]|uniref:Uncharacterized protein n=1 Tax=Auriscalpium vulgare TaxID=40419 RepID=A0ACB8S780_9AGAM|nr:hypothetical protein FA95DRAFT_1593202 [Auriscalpium vulgare]
MFSSLRQVSRSTSALRSAQRSLRPAVFLPGRTLVTKRYTKEHEAISFDDETGVGIVSITDFAQTSLGDVVFVELPEEGSAVEPGQSVGAVESVKAASDIYSPVSGEVVAINEELGSSPSLLNKSPEEKGWLFKVKLSDPSEVDGLLTAEQYKEHCES